MATTTDSTLTGAAAPAATPTGCQSLRTLARRRWLFLALNALTYLGLVGALVHVLGAGGWSVVDAIMLLCFLVASPWTVLGFWNAAIGLWLLHGVRDGLARAAPWAAAGDDDTPILVRTAVLMTLRNEDPGRAFARLHAVKASLDATGQGTRFDYFILSDTNDTAIAAAEEAEYERWSRDIDETGRAVYRRRESNLGFKAGNLRDFCQRWGRDYELMLPLDADSLMDGPTIIRLTRIMQAHPRLGILQSLVVGMPSRSAFARLFQFGMRHAMRSYTMGSAWWTGDCGPFWGHNALVRIAPFIEHCTLPLLPGKPPLGGHVLSHDQVEAVLMRRAGWEVRVLPLEGGSWEENPPTLLEFTRRDLRWCQGNLQYLKLLSLPRLLPVSRFQLVWAIAMFLGIPAWTLMIALAALKPFDGEDLAAFPTGVAAGLYLVFLTMFLAPKLAGLIDTILSRGAVARYGGPLRFSASAMAEQVFSFLLSAATTFRTTIFMLGLACGRSIEWGGQSRDVHALSWTAAFRGLWPQLLFGIIVAGLLALAAPGALIWSLPLIAGYVVAIPLAVLTAHPAAGRFCVRSGLAGIPEDFATPPEIRAVEPAARPRMASWLERRTQALKGIARSIRVYHGDHDRHRRMDALYSRFLKPGDLAFDLGAHVGDRVRSFRRLGARVVAVEPMAGPRFVIRLLFALDRKVTILAAAVGDAIGTLRLRINTANPTVTTASDAFVAAADGARGWEGQHWDDEVVLPCTTLDALIAAHGRPAFVKIDVEGFEAKVLAGLSSAVPALSFEFTTIQRGVAARCIARLMALGDYRFDLALGESQSLTFGRWAGAEEMAAHLASLPHEANSGDVYAVLAEKARS